MYIAFNQMPSNSRVWIYQAARAFSQPEEELICSTLHTFCQEWNTHGNPMTSSFQIQDHQILILTVDENNLGVSGCSIDGSVKILRELEIKLNNNLTDHGKVSYLTANNGIAVTPALGIKSKVLAGEITATTSVINPLIQRKKELDSIWIAADKTWINKYF